MLLVLTVSGTGGIVPSKAPFREGVPIAEIGGGGGGEGDVPPHPANRSVPPPEDGQGGLVAHLEDRRKLRPLGRGALRLNDRVQAKVVAIKEDGKIDLSIKALQDPAPRIDRRSGRDPGFEQMLKKFMRQSEERQVDYKRSVENKRK